MTAKEASPPDSWKRPESVLVVVYTIAGEVLLLQRAEPTRAWQSVTGSMHWDEASPTDTARRELLEETGLAAGDRLQDWSQKNRYPIHPLWKPRYHPGDTHNTEYVFSLALPEREKIALNPGEHSGYCWQPFGRAIQMVRFETNRAAIETLMNSDQ